MRGDEERDELITSALRSYAEPEAIPEARIVLARVMERVQTMGSRRRGIWVWAMPMAACAAAFLIVSSIWMARVTRTPQIAWTPQPPPAAPAVGGKVAPERTVAVFRQTRRRAVVRRATAQSENLPKLDVFPSPKPLYPEEEALAFFAQPGQAAATQQVLSAQKHLSDPIDIADLKIRPLQIEDDPVSPTGKEK